MTHKLSQKTSHNYNRPVKLRGMVLLLIDLKKTFCFMHSREHNNVNTSTSTKIITENTAGSCSFQNVCQLVFHHSPYILCMSVISLLSLLHNFFFKVSSDDLATILNIKNGITYFISDKSCCWQSN